MNFWHERSESRSEVIRYAAKAHPGALKTEIQLVDAVRPGRGRCRVEDDYFSAKTARSTRYEDLDHEVWTKLSAEGPASPSEWLETQWPPERSLEGYCLMEKLTHRDDSACLVIRQTAYETVSCFIRAALHPWCLRCYRVRCQSRDTWQPCALLDTVFMFFGILVVLAVEWYIAWNDMRVPHDAGFTEKFRMAWTVFLESGVEEGALLVPEREEVAMKPRHRSVSCPF